MSIESVAIALHHSRARGTAKLVLIGIANHDGDGGAWPSLATLAKYAGVDPRNVRKALRELEALGEIRTHIQAGGTGQGPAYERPNLYDFLLCCPTDCDRSTRHRVTYPPDESVPRGRTPASGAPRTDASPKPSSEPSVEPSFSGSSDPWASQPVGDRASSTPRERSRKPKRDPNNLDDMNADYQTLKAICLEEGLDDNPLHIWWTLRNDHKALWPSAFLRAKVDAGHWDGFAGRFGITEYQANGDPA